MAKNQKTQPIITQDQFEAMMKEVEQLKEENAKLRQNKRPEGAAVITGNVTLPKGTGKEFLGSSASKTIRTNDGLVLHIVGDWKESKSSGNTTARITGYIDRKKLNLSGEKGKVRTAEQKTSQSFQQQVVDQ